MPYTLSGAHWAVVSCLRDEYPAHAHRPNFRLVLKGLPQPLGKGGY